MSNSPLLASSTNEVHEEIAKKAQKTNCSPQTPDLAPGGEKISRPSVFQRAKLARQELAQLRAAKRLAKNCSSGEPVPESPAEAGIVPPEPQTEREQFAPDAPTKLQPEPQCDAAIAEPVEAAPLAAVNDVPPRPVRRGRQPVLDEFAQGKLVGLMAYGLTFRQAAAMLEVDHKTITNTLSRDPELAAAVAQARLAAISKPLMKVIAESEKSWRAATWLVNYLERRMFGMAEETPEERLVRKELSQQQQQQPKPWRS